ncbi:hypothetical protein DL96DRAFT_1717163 [Flagelloscypha sp. PMI_526]|nr:hypothetical protein DL96DRAFT_1717163 [Flagelloscypha sp. PMI_526]
MADSTQPLDPATFKPDLPDELLFIEKMWLQGALLSSIGYGAVVVLSYMCIYFLVSEKRGTGSKAFKNYFIVYVLALFIMATLFQACNSKFTELAFIDNRMYPGGPAAYENDFFSIPVDAAGNVVFVLANWSTDALLLWRFFTIYRQSRIPLPVLLFVPILAGLGSIAMGCLFLFQLFKSNVLETSVANTNWTLPYLALSLSLNVLLSLAIVGRLLLFRYRVSKALGNGYGGNYTSIASIIIESAGFHALLALLFIIPYGIGSSVAIVFLPLLMPDQCLASLLIIFRVAQGQAWTTNTSTAVMRTTNGSGSTAGAATKDTEIAFKVMSTKSVETKVSETSFNGKDQQRSYV